MRLKAALRQDPDVILVGEMRDLETISTALTAAETGHLVFATLHTQDTAQTIDRIIDVFPPEQQGQVRVQLSVALQGIVTQQLLPTADGSGRVAACEVLVPNPAVRNLIREGKTHQIYSVLQTGSAQGMQTMDAALVSLMRTGKVSQKQAEARSSRLRSCAACSAPERWRRMSTYVFKAMDLAGVKARGEIDADSKEAVSNQLKSRGMIVLDIADKHASREIELSFMKTVKAGELAVFSRQLATMISSGLSILRALYVLEEQTDNKFLKETVVQVRKDVEAGLSLSGRDGIPPEGLQSTVRGDDQSRRGRRSAGGLADAGRRPAGEGSFAAPADPLGDDLPGARHHLRGGCDDGAGRVPGAGVRRRVQAVRRRTARHHPGLGGRCHTLSSATGGRCSAGAGLSAFTFIKWKKSKWGRPQWDRFRLRVPMKIGAIVQQVAVARWSRTLSSLMSAGVPLLLALEIVGKTGGNVAVEEAMDGVIASVKRGGTLAEPLSKTSIFPTMVTHMVGVGEETGALDAMLAKVADFYEDQVEASVKALTSILEPIMIIVIGSIVGFIVISMYMPMFTVYNHIE